MNDAAALAAADIGIAIGTGTIGAGNARRQVTLSRTGPVGAVAERILRFQTQAPPADDIVRSACPAPMYSAAFDGLQ